MKMLFFEHLPKTFVLKSSNFKLACWVLFHEYNGAIYLQNPTPYEDIMNFQKEINHLN